MSQQEELILYDLKSTAPLRSWSGNVWKTRLALNYKGIPYKTVWVPFTQLQEKIKSLGVPPNPPEGRWSEYSVPVVRFPDGSHVMDSAAIAKELEARYPKTPSLRLNAELEHEVQETQGGAFFALVPGMMQYTPNIVAPEDLDWFKADRAQRFGMTVEEAFETKRDMAPYLEAAKPSYEKLARLLRKYQKDSGPFVLGSEPSYADFYIVASLHLMHEAGSAVWTEFWAQLPTELKELYKACEKWMVRQD